jgi:hypothetical protein
MSYRLEFDMLGLPKTTNSIGRAHWTVKAKEARRWITEVCVAVGSRKPVEPLPKARLMLTRYSSAEPDFDGLVSSFKHVIDGLIHAQILASDKPSVIGSPTYAWQKCPPRAGKITVIVEAIHEMGTRAG